MDVETFFSVSPNDPLPSGADVINKLPNEVLLNIFGYLDSKDIVKNISGVSQRFEALTKNPTLLNKIVFNEEDCSDESMIDALVGDGDLVLIEPITKPNNGDMVAAWLEDREEATLKHFYLEGNKVRLVPANSMMQPITVSASNVAVKGRVVGVMRTM